MSNDSILVDERLILSYWDALAPDITGSQLLLAEQDFVDSFKKIAIVNNEGDELLYSSRGWKLNIMKNFMENFVNASLVGTFLCMTKVTDLPAALITMILGSICRLEKIELLKSEESIYMKLPLKEKFASSDEWYRSLPASIKKDISRLMFIDFMEKLVLVGLAKKEKDADDKYMVFEKGRLRFKISFF